LVGDSSFRLRCIQNDSYVIPSEAGRLERNPMLPSLGRDSSTPCVSEWHAFWQEILHSAYATFRMTSLYRQKEVSHMLY